MEMKCQFCQISNWLSCFVPFFKLFFLISQLSLLKKELSHLNGNSYFLGDASVKYFRRSFLHFQAQRWQNFCQAVNLKDIRFFSSNSIYPYSSLGVGRAALPSILSVGKGGIRK